MHSLVMPFITGWQLHIIGPQTITSSTCPGPTFSVVFLIVQVSSSSWTQLLAAVLLPLLLLSLLPLPLPTICSVLVRFALPQCHSCQSQ